MYTYEVAPVFNCMENIILEKIGDLFNKSDVILVPGGSMSNMYALHVAKFNYDSNLNKVGFYNMKRGFKIYVSEHSHYSFEKGAMFMGFGLNSIVKIKTLQTGQMDIVDLDNKIKSCEGIPLIIIATSGTTVLSDGKMMISFQPLSCWNLPNFFRMVFIKDELGINNLDEIIYNINEIGLSITN